MLDTSMTTHGLITRHVQSNSLDVFRSRPEDVKVPHAGPLKLSFEQGQFVYYVIDVFDGTCSW